MALLASHRRVGPDKRKPVLVFLDGIRRNLPAEHGMELCAVRAKFSAMDVGVAIGAVLTDVRKDRFNVTLRAGHFFVHSAKRVSRFIVVEFRDRLYGTPARIGVAILARYGEWSVRTPSGFSLRASKERMGWLH